MKKNLMIGSAALALLTALIAVSPARAGDGQEWNEKRSPHFLVLYQDVPKDFVDEVAKSAEHYYDEISRNLGLSRFRSWSYDQRARIYIYSDQDSFIEGGSARWAHGVAFAQEKIIRTFPTAHGFFDSTLPHELGHIIFREYVGYRAVLPSWFEEGVAMYQERAKRWGANDKVRQAMQDGTFIPLTDLSLRRLLRGEADQEKINLFYAEAASVVYFLIQEYGETRFTQMCRALKSGETFTLALTSTYRQVDSLEELDELWQKSLKSSK